MRKQTALKWSAFLTLLSLIYMVLAYYGLVRYAKLHIQPLDVYVEPYKHLDKASEDKRTVVSFTTTPERLDKLKPFLNSILDQTVRVDEVALSIPYKDIKKVPKEIKKIVTVYGYTKDYDDGGSLIPTLLREREGDTHIIIVQDDMVYGKDYIEQMIDASKENDTEVVYGMKNKDLKGGVLIKPDFFDTKVADYVKGSGCIGWLGKCVNANDRSIDYKEIYRVW